MAIPANLTSVVLRGTFITPEGEPSTGTISFTPSSWLINSGANVSIPNSTITKTLGTAGDFEVTLPVTDDADVSPGDWVYSVSEVVDGVSQNYNILLPGTVGGTAYLADIAPAAAAGPEYYSLASSLTIGTVTKIAAGGTPTATITGLAPNQTLDLGLVTGDTGSVSTLGTGTAGTPAIYPTGDTNTGLFFPAADTVAVATGGTERLRIDSNGLITGTGTSLGAWTAYTPTLGGSGWALGDGTATGAYCQIGKIVHFRLQITFGSTSTFGGVAPWVTMPTGATEIGQGVVSINCRFFDASLGNMYEGLVRNDGVNMSLRYYGTNALHEPVVSGGPFTWATTDFIRISGTYQAA